jgi:hypothetical protein
VGKLAPCDAAASQIIFVILVVIAELAAVVKKEVSYKAVQLSKKKPDAILACVLVNTFNAIIHPGLL